jgi:hypothetical protein
MSMTPFLILWACVACAAIGIALYRKLLTRNEDDYIHVGEGTEKLVQQQTALAQRLEAVERWEKILIIVAAVGGVLLAAAYIYLYWRESQMPVG